MAQPVTLTCRWCASAAVFACALGSADAAHALSPDIVISQVYGGGGNSGATYTNDFIELYNRGTSPVVISGWSVQYASSTGATWQKTDIDGTLQPGAYYLIQEAQGAGGTQPLPSPNAVGTIPMSSTTGKVALVNNRTLLSGTCPSVAAGIIDLVGFGAANCSEGTPTPALSNTTAALRNGGGAQETDNNAADFTLAAPLPRSGESAPSVLSVSPANGATNVGTATPVQVTFSEPVNLDADAVSVECPVGTIVETSPAQASVSSVTLTMALGLPTGVTCRVRVAAGSVHDVDTSDPPDNLAADFISTFGTAGGVPCSAPDTPIGAIQGTGTSAALSGSQTVQGVVVADFELPGSGTSSDYLRGFYVQNAPGSDDGNPATSDAIFVFNGNSNSVSVGQIVQVTGTVSEFAFSSTGGTQTQLTSASIEVCGGSGNVLPVDVTLPLGSATDLERYEGMLVRFPQTLSVTEHFQLGRFGQVLLSAGGRLPQPTEVAAPGAAALSQQAANDLNQIMLDDDLQSQNPDPIRFGRGTAPLSASNTLRGGDTVTSLTGVLTQTDATTASNVPSTTDPVLYRVRPFNTLNAVAPNFVAVNTRPSEPAVVNGALKVAGVNLLNYFNTLGTSGQANCNAGVGGAAVDCRGAENQTEFDRQWPKTVAGLLAINADVYVLNELENDGYGAASALQDLVTKLNNATSAGTFAFIDVDARTGQVNALGSDAIRVAMIYRPSKVSLVGQTAVANTGAFGIYQTGSGAIQRNRPALAQAFQLANGARVVVVGNHLKSKGSSCADNISPVAADPDLGDGQGECNQTRKAAAVQLASWLATDPTQSGTGKVLLMGDYNAYAKEDPITALGAAGYTDLATSRIHGGYSYVFDGQWGALDHALASTELLNSVQDVLEYHINADEPSALDYNTNFKSAAQLTSLYAADRFRVSDHDSVIVGLNLLGPGAPVPALPSPWALAGLMFALAATGGWAVYGTSRRGRAL